MARQVVSRKRAVLAFAVIIAGGVLLGRWAVDWLPDD